jgi:hypothetical protein
METAGAVAKFFRIQGFTAVELGVGDGAGIRVLAALANELSAHSGLTIRVVGFDSGLGLPAPLDYRDHPEIWSNGDFSNSALTDLVSDLPSNCTLAVGAFSRTLPQFLETQGSDLPLGLVVVDADTYSSTKDALTVFTGPAEGMMPVIPVYFDDIFGRPNRISSLFRNRWAGQLLAVSEFNAEHERRKLDRAHNLDLRYPAGATLWQRKILVEHTLDHPLRNRQYRSHAVTVAGHEALRDYDWPL